MEYTYRDCLNPLLVGDNSLLDQLTKWHAFETMVYVAMEIELVIASSSRSHSKR